MRLTEINHRTLITEGWNDPHFTLLETKTIIPFVDSIEKFIVEAKLTPDQINQLFTNVEKSATAAGGNRTLVGKGKDAASFINKKIDELGAKLKQAGPVKNADQKFNDLKNKIGSKDSKVVKAVQGVSDWAKENPGKASIAVGILTTAAAMATGPMGGAVAGFIARATKDLLQGADLSTAAGKAAKTGVIGALVGFGVEKIGDMLGSALAWGNDTFNPSYMTAEWNYSESNSAEFDDWATAKLTGYPDDIEPIRDMWKEATAALKANDYDKFNSVWPNIESAVDELNNPEYLESLEGTEEARAEWQAGMQAFSKMMDGVAAGAQGAAQASDDKKETTQFNTIQIETIIEWCDDTPAAILTEAPMDAIKKAGSAVGGALKKGAAAVGAKAAKVGKNITTKVTADKLNKAWVKAGKPTDSDAIANILRQQGVDDKILAPVYKQMGAKLPAAPTATDAPKTNAAPQQSKPSTQQTPTAKQGTAAPQKSAAPAIDFKSVQQAVAKLSAEDAKGLIAHIDSLNKGTGQTPAAQPQAAPEKNAAAGDTYEKAKGDIRKAQSGTKPIPPKAAADIQTAIAKLAKGDKESGVFAAQKIMNLARAGVDISKQQQAWVANAKAGERFLTQSVYFEITKMLRENNLSWSDLGMRVHLLEDTNQLFGISYI